MYGGVYIEQQQGCVYGGVYIYRCMCERCEDM